MDDQARARSKQRRAMAEELEKRERASAQKLSDLQRAQANLAEQMRRLRERAVARKRAELSSQAATAAQAAAAAVAEASAAGVGAQEGAQTGRDAAPQVDAETLTLLKSSLQVRWSTDHVKHDASSMRELFSQFGEVVHVSMRKPKSRAGPNRSAVVVMGNSTAASKACKRAAATVRHPLLVVPLPKVADVDGLTVAAPGAAQAAAARLRRADIAEAAAAAPAVAPPRGQDASDTAAAGGAAAGGAWASSVPSSFPGASARPAAAPSSFPSSFPAARKPAAHADVPGSGSGTAVGPQQQLPVDPDAADPDGVDSPEARGDRSGEKAGTATEPRGDGAHGHLRDAGGAGGGVGRAGQGGGKSAAAKQLEREVMRAKLLAEAEAEDALQDHE